MNLRWDPRALQDLNSIRRFLATTSSPRAAERVRKHLLARVNRLRKRPYLGPPSINNPDIRILAPIHYPYRVYYTVQGQEIDILHIRHTARQSPDDIG
jgi:toxin ParE1/3/4